MIQVKNELKANFKMKDMGELHWLLNIEVKRDRYARTISFAQGAYIDLIIKRFNLQDAAPILLPMDPNTTLTKDQSPNASQEFEHMKNVPYREAIGSLMWAAMGTRPDIAFAVSLLSQFMENPGHVHWEAVKRVLKYLKGTRNYKLTFGDGEKGLRGFTDADWGQQPDRHSISGHCFLLDGGAFSWSSNKQRLVTLSSAESEFVAITNAVKEACWIRSFLGEIFRPLAQPITLYCDNQAAIIISNNNKFQGRTKHIDIRYKFIYEIIENEMIQLQYCSTENMVADIFTKALPRSKLLYFLSLLGFNGCLA
jgi:hypothetical protein